MGRTLLSLVIVAAFSVKLVVSWANGGNGGPLQSSSLQAELQKCYSPVDVLNFVSSNKLDANPSFGKIASLVLLRLSKFIITLDNKSRHLHEDSVWRSELTRESEPWDKLSQIIAQSLSAAGNNFGHNDEADYLVDAVKSMSVLSRLLPQLDNQWDPCLEALSRCGDKFVSIGLEPHELSGLKWAYDCMHLYRKDLCIPPPIVQAYERLNLPFRIRPGSLNDLSGMNLNTLVSQVGFQVEDIRTSSNHIVKERRKTAWEGDDGVAPFAYSGKSMERRSWSPLVKSVRDRLQEITGVYYDGCLLNLYPDGGSGMRYHIDPDQGMLWDYSTAVVSLGATRMFAFRQISRGSKLPHQKPHSFVLMEGDVTEMFDDCQFRFQHSVKTAEDREEQAARASLVFKKRFGVPN
jgi:alkylated DNA repair dioxygenase AlkB